MGLIEKMIIVSIGMWLLALLGWVAIHHPLLLIAALALALWYFRRPLGTWLRTRSAAEEGPHADA